MGRYPEKTISYQETVILKSLRNKIAPYSATVALKRPLVNKPVVFVQ